MSAKEGDDSNIPQIQIPVLTPLPFRGDFELTQAFGENPAIYRRFNLPGHNGLDWGMPVGEEILAVDEGFVILVKEEAGGFGRHIKIQHQWGQSLYAHLSQFKAVLNQPVKQGDVIGLSGNSGFSTGPHLHFGMRTKPYEKNDGWYGYTNPQRYLKWPAAGAIAQPALPPDRAALIFQLQELLMQNELWREKVIYLLQRYLPGDLPADADPMAVLEKLMSSWHEELQSLRSQSISQLFGKQAIHLTRKSRNQRS